MTTHSPGLRGDLNGTARAIAALKLQREPSPEEFQLSLAAWDEATDHLYRALALDIDGTITVDGGTTVDPRAAVKIGELL
ncbi:MAG TPA: hypothetical protein VMF60_01240, partial [Acidimicrobiales bacterium]|nr:hypothetical protein [Acidimicrobiales bacterium]